ncbi:chondroitin sulfate synthase 1-like [Liolophura sinensis]|uniref:chondroitin sulfate synthase 1-like n=1 Tax=Liolophura sinensis TaxID=3198878 RepID=UPI003159731B
MTADQYINTRARAICDTWAQAVSGKVLFFVGSASTYRGDLPVVRLPDVPQEDYPPQKKAFKMLEYMYDNYIDEYEWFFRADDDVYIKGDKIESLLRSINSSQPWYIGQSGEGRRHEQGKLGLIEDMPYCIGGPGVMISHVALAQLGPNVPSCMKSVTTKHEDTEVGRCMQRTVGIGCSSAYELRKLMYQNYREKNGSFTHELGKEEKMAFTLHPIKSAPYVYRMHNFVSAQNIQIMKDKVNKLQKEIKTMESYILKLEMTSKKLDLETADEDIQNGGVFPGTYVNDSVYVWEYASGGVYFSHKSVHTKLSSNGRADESTSLAIAHSWARRLRESFPHNFMKIDKTLPSYIKISPLDGVYMHLNLQVSYNKKESHKIKKFFAPIELKQPFSALDFFEGKDYFRPFSEQNHVDPIRMLVPLSGKYKVLRRFLARHIPIVFKSDIPITVVFLLFKGADGEVLKNTDAIQSFQRIYPSCDILLIDHSKENFSRSRALTYGANLFENDSLLLFMDIDMIFTEDFPRRVQLNTIQGKQVYFPIYFSQYHPDFICYQEEDCVVREMDLTKFSGIWRHYGFGMVGVYKSDFLSVGGFDTSIIGWGKEDVDFHERVIAHKLMAFRAADPVCFIFFMRKSVITVCLVTNGECAARLKRTFGHPHEL